MGDTGAVPEIVLVRHGQTEWSRDHRHTGRTDIPLTEEGRRQAQEAGRRLAGREFDRILTSPLSRALETCKMAGFGEPAELRDDLMEWDYGEYDGLTTLHIREGRPGWFLWRDGCPGGELAADVGTRVDPVVAELREADGDVAVFAHGHVLRVLAARWLELAPAEGAKFVLDTATLSTLGWERESPAIRVWNAQGPLPA
jgi:probable phosphoglycerate mutase